MRFILLSSAFVFAMATTGHPTMYDNAAIADVAAALAFSLFPDAAWATVKTALGDDALNDLNTIGSIGNEVYCPIVDAANFTVIQKTRFNIFVNVVRKVVGLPWRSY